MSWRLEGTYFEDCNCDFACPCTVLGLPATGDRCTFFLAFHIDRGNVEGLDVSGRNVAFVGETPKVMGEGNWRVGWIIDDGATEDQFEKLVSVFTGKMGGPMGDLTSAFGTVLGVERHRMEYADDGLKHCVRVGTDVSIEVEDYVRPGLAEPTRVVGIPHPVNTTLTIARPTTSKIKAFGMEFHNEGKSAFSAPYSWAG